MVSVRVRLILFFEKHVLAEDRHGSLFFIGEVVRMFIVVNLLLVDDSKLLHGVHSLTKLLSLVFFRIRVLCKARALI